MSHPHFIFALLLVLSGCSGSDEPTYVGSPFEINPPHDLEPSGGPVSCTTTEESPPNPDCSAGQLNVIRCTGAIENPDADHCAEPRANTKPAQASSRIWCCAAR